MTLLVQLLPHFRSHPLLVLIQLMVECHHLLTEWMKRVFSNTVERGCVAGCKSELYQHVSAGITVCEVHVLPTKCQLSLQEMVCSSEDWELTGFVTSTMLLASWSQCPLGLSEVPCLLTSWTNVHEITKSESPKVSTIFLCLALVSGFIIRLYSKGDRIRAQHSHDDDALSQEDNVDPSKFAHVGLSR